MKFDKKTRTSTSRYMIYAALAAIVLAGVGWLSVDIWLASTQWLLVAAVLALFGIYLRLN